MIATLTGPGSETVGWSVDEPVGRDEIPAAVLDDVFVFDVGDVVATLQVSVQHSLEGFERVGLARPKVFAFGPANDLVTDDHAHRRLRSGNREGMQGIAFELSP